jgi:biopolymer transport protein ExbB
MDFTKLLLEIVYFILIPILVFSFVPWLLFRRKIREINKASNIQDEVVKIIYGHVDAGDIQGAIKICNAHANDPFYLIVQKGLNCVTSNLAELPINEIDNSVTGNAKIEINKHKNSLDLFASLVSIFPSIGFLGTLVGMLIVFYQNSTISNPEIKDIAGGIYTKIFMSIDGISLGIFAKILHASLASRITRLKDIYNIQLVSFLDHLLKLKSNSVSTYTHQ